jgi:hypothetical protein
MLALLALAWFVPSPAGAFWPFTRERRSAPPDSAAVARMEERYRTWIEGQSAPAPGTATTATTATTPAMVMPAAAPRSEVAPPPSPVVADTTAPAAVAAPPGWETTGVSGQGVDPDSVDAGIAPSPAPAAPPPPSAPPGIDPATNPAAQAAAAAAAVRGFAPEFSTRMSTTNDYSRLNSQIGATFSDAGGVSLTSNLSYSTDLSLTQGSETETRGITTGFRLPIKRLGLSLNLATSNSRMDQSGARTVGAASQNNAAETRSADVGLALSHRLDRIRKLRSAWGLVRGTGVNAFYSRRAGHNDKSTIAVGGSGSGETRHTDVGHAYGVGLAYDRLSWIGFRARAGTSRRDNKDRLSPTDPTERESSSEGDTATVDVTAPGRGMIKDVSLRFQASRGNDTSIDLARTASGGQSSTVGAYVIDTHESVRSTVTLGFVLRPFSRLDVRVATHAGRTFDDYEIRANAFNDTRRAGVRLDSKFAYSKGGTLGVVYEENRADLDLDEDGRPNAGTKEETDRKLHVEVVHKFTETMSATVWGDVKLMQGFYAHEGPRGFADRDELRQEIGFDFKGRIGKRVTADAKAWVATFDQAFIDPRSSSQSRNQTEYIVRPSYTWNINERITLRQSFGLSSKVIEEIFQEDRDTLNRNHYMRSEMGYQATARLSTDVSYDYLLQDNGRYIVQGGESYFAPTARTKKDGIGVGIRYDVVRGGKLVVVARQEATRSYGFSFRGGKAQAPKILEQGNLALGVESDLDWKDLRLDCRVYRNETSNVALYGNVYYNVDATLSYTF